MLITINHKTKHPGNFNETICAFNVKQLQYVTLIVIVKCDVLLQKKRKKKNESKNQLMYQFIFQRSRRSIIMKGLLKDTFFFKFYLTDKSTRFLINFSVAHFQFHSAWLLPHKRETHPHPPDTHTCT